MLEFIIETARRGKNGEKYALYRCLECPNRTEKELLINNVKRGHTKSCGCLKNGKFNITHGMRYTTEYNSWCNMKARCYNKKYTKYNNWGGRGIEVCDRWKYSFENFFADMGLKPDPNMQIERINNDGDYEPGNCKWATVKEEANNRRSNHNIPFNGETKTMQQWSEQLNIPYRILQGRLIRGWSIEKTFTTPVRKR